MFKSKFARLMHAAILVYGVFYTIIKTKVVASEFKTIMKTEKSEE